MAVTNVTPKVGGNQGGVSGITIAVDSGATGKTHSDCLFGGIACPAAGFSVTDDFTISCQTPAHAAGDVDVAVTGIGTLAGGFHFDYFNWSQITIGYVGANNFRDSIYVAARGFIFVGDGGLIYKSVAGAAGTWSQKVSPGVGTQAWKCIAYSPTLGTGQGRLVIAGNSGSLAYSDDFGDTWIAGTTPSASQWSSLAWAPWLNAFYGVTPTVTANQFMTSADGITFTGVAAPASKSWNGIAASTTLSMLCAVATDAVTSNNIATSLNGSAWTSQLSIVSQTFTTTGRWVLADTSVGFLFPCKSPSSAAAQIQHSTDGASWSTTAPTKTIGTGVGTGNPQRYVYLTSKGVIFAAGANSDTFRSADLVTIERYPVPYPPLTTYALASGFCQVWADDLGVLVSTSNGTPNNMLYGVYVSPYSVVVNMGVAGSTGNEQETEVTLDDGVTLVGSYTTVNL